MSGGGKALRVAGAGRGGAAVGVEVAVETSGSPLSARGASAVSVVDEGAAVAAAEAVADGVGVAGEACRTGNEVSLASRG